MQKSWLRPLLGGLFVLFGAVTVSCDRASVFDRPLAGQGAYVLQGAFVTWDTAREAFVRVDLTAPIGERHPVTWHAAGGEVRTTRVTPTGDALVVLSPDERALTVLPATGGDAQIYPLGQPFNQLTLSDDGAYLVAYAGEGDTVAGVVAVGHNLLSLVSLREAPGEENPVTRSISSYGGARLGVDISPGFLVDGAAHRLAVVRSEGHVALVDLTDPTADAIAVPLVVPGDPTDLRTRAARFALREDGRGGLWVFLTAAGNGDVIVLEVGGALDTEGQPTDGLKASLNQHAVGGWVADALPVRSTDGTLYVVALSSNGRQLKMIDVESGEAVTFSLDVGFNTLTRFDVPDDEGIQRPYLLLSVYQSSHFATLAIDDVAERGVKALRERSLRSRYESLVPIPGQPRFVAFTGEGTSLALVWLAREAAEDTVAFAGLRQGYAFSADGTALHLLVDISAEERYVVTLDLPSGQLSELALEPAARSLHQMPDTGQLLVVHDVPVGLLSLFPPGATEPEEGERIMGFLLDDVFGE